VLWATVVALFGTLEAVFPFALPLLPLNLQPFVTWPFRLLCQSSKKRALPTDYVAILGDSYAQGFGDWLIRSNPWANGPFHSAHVLYGKLGADVLVFGQSGMGSIGGLVRTPVNDLRIIRYRFHLDDPVVVLVYFYEGNDLSDNLEELIETRYFRDQIPRPLDHDEFFAWLDREVLKHKPAERSSGSLLFSKFVLRLAKNVSDRLHGRQLAPQALDTFSPSNSYNMATVGGSRVQLPGRLQAPELELSADEVAIGLQVFDLSLERAMRALSRSKFFVVYVPSVLSCYGLTGAVSVRTAWRRAEIYPANAVWARSEDLAERVRLISQEHGVEFIDPRPEIREAASRSLIHGPLDWRHFNRLGYEALAEGIIDSTALRSSITRDGFSAWRATGPRAAAAR